jgi:hypothetical protein
VDVAQDDLEFRATNFNTDIKPLVHKCRATLAEFPGSVMENRASSFKSGSSRFLFRSVASQPCRRSRNWTIPMCGILSRR